MRSFKKARFELYFKLKYNEIQVKKFFIKDS